MLNVKNSKGMYVAKTSHLKFHSQFQNWIWTLKVT